MGASLGSASSIVVSPHMPQPDWPGSARRRAISRSVCSFSNRTSIPMPRAPRRTSIRAISDGALMMLTERLNHRAYNVSSGRLVRNSEVVAAISSCPPIPFALGSNDLTDANIIVIRLAVINYHSRAVAAAAGLPVRDEFQNLRRQQRHTEHN